MTHIDIEYEGWTFRIFEHPSGRSSTRYFHGTICYPPTDERYHPGVKYSTVYSSKTDYQRPQCCMCGMLLPLETEKYFASVYNLLHLKKGSKYNKCRN